MIDIIPDIKLTVGVLLTQRHGMYLCHKPSSLPVLVLHDMEFIEGGVIPLSSYRDASTETRCTWENLAFGYKVFPLMTFALPFRNDTSVMFIYVTVQLFSFLIS